jgi:hypothetical protein
MFKRCLVGCAMLCAVWAVPDGAAQSGIRFEFGRPEKEVKTASEGQEARRRARDIFVVTVKRVDTIPENPGHGVIVKARASIDSVVRSSQAQRSGEEIIIRYRTTAGTMYETSGDPTIPAVGEKFKVYLTYAGAGRYYRLAAGGYSFVRMNAEAQPGAGEEDAPVSTGAVRYRDPYRAEPQEQMRTMDGTEERQRLNGIRAGGAMPETTDPYAGGTYQQERDNRDPYEPVGL